MVFVEMSRVLGVSPWVCVLVAVCSVLYVCMTRRRVPANIPPFPATPLPFIGHVHMFKDGPAKLLKDLRKKSGDIVSVYIGSQLMVILNTHAVLKEAFVKHADVMSDRPETFLSAHIPHAKEGILGSSGANWKEQRSVSVAILRRFGMGKNFLVAKINEEVSFYLQALAATKGAPTSVQVLTNASVSNVMCGILVGTRFEHDDAEFLRLISLLNENIRLIGSLQVLTLFPWLRFVPGDRFGARKILDNYAEIRKHFCEKHILANKGRRVEEGEQGEEGEEGEQGDNFITAYLHEMDARKKAGKPTYLDESNLTMSISNLFLAGTESTSTAVLWALLFIIHFPDTQDKIYEEIEAVVGRDRQPTYEDKAQMRYTHAFMQETLRFGAVAPSSMAHYCSSDVSVGGYTIPRGASVMANLMGILHDEGVWGDPHVFRPERFLSQNEAVTPIEEFVPFCLGRRFCMGDALAKMELFLFVTGIVQRFLIRAEHPDKLPSMDVRFGIANAPEEFKIRLIERQ